MMKREKPSEEVEEVIKKAGGKLLKSLEVFDVYTGENVGPDEKSIAYNLVFNDKEKTLNDEEISTLFHKIIDRVQTECNVKLRSE